MNESDLFSWLGHTDTAHALGRVVRLEAAPGKLPTVVMEFDDPRKAELVAEFFEQNGMTVEWEPPRIRDE